MTRMLPPLGLTGSSAVSTRWLAYDAPLLGAVTRLFVDSILGWYQRHLRTSTRELAQSGAVVAVHRAKWVRQREHPLPERHRWQRVLG